MSTGGSYTGEGIFALNPTTVSTASISNSLSTNWAIENLLTCDRTFGKHQVNAVGLYSAEQTLYNRSQLSAKDIPADALQFYNLGRAAGEYTVDPNNQDSYGCLHSYNRWHWLPHIEFAEPLMETILR